MSLPIDNMDGLTLTEYVSDYIDYLLDTARERYGIDFTLVSMFIFLTEPNSSKAAHRWNLFLAVFVGLYILVVLVESCDGPNKYLHKSDESLYTFLLTDHEYWAVSIMCWTPLIIDAMVRLCMLGYVFGHSENEEIAEELWEDKFTLITMIGDIICIVPFLVRAAYFQPNNIRLDQGWRVLLRIIELLSISRILRSTKDIPAIKTIRIALSRAAKHLVLPIFFFFAFNVFAAVIVYFSEPCYNTATCPWVDLFDASFFSVVTMTTTGYGDQVPYYLTTRMIALVIMIFGALFISLPLAIIGNEYDEAWTEVKSAADAATTAADAATALQKTPAHTPTPDNTAVQHTKDKDGGRDGVMSKGVLLASGRVTPTDSTRPAGSIVGPGAFHSIAEEEEEGDCNKSIGSDKATGDDDSAGNLNNSTNNSTGLGMGMAAVNFAACITPSTDDGDEDDMDGGVLSNYTHICFIALNLRAEFDELGAISPTILLNMCELRGWMSSIRWQISNCLKAALGVKRYVAALTPPVPVPLPATKILSLNRTVGIPRGRGRRNSFLGGGRQQMVQVAPLNTDGGNSSANMRNSGRTSPERAMMHQFNEKAVLARGDSLLIDATRMRSVSDMSEGELSELDRSDIGSGEGVGDIELGNNNTIVETGCGATNNSSGNVHGVDAEEGVRSANATEAADNKSNQSNNSNSSNTDIKRGKRDNIFSRNTFRGIGTIFREQLQKLTDEQMAQGHGGQGPVGGGNNGGKGGSESRLPARSLLIMLAKASKDVRPGGAHSTDFTKKMVRAARNPNSVRSRLWMLLELPSSSREARGLRYVLMFLIMLSVFVLYTQTLTSLSRYGEKTDICGQVLNLYCNDKHDPTLDPGCFNQNVDFTQKLKFKKCEDDDDQNCFRKGFNFGSSFTNLTCSNKDEDGAEYAVKPFRNQDQLIQAYGMPNIGNRREDSHMIYAICTRVECSNHLGTNADNDGNTLWIPLEVVINLVFTLELLLRILVAESYKDFLMDILNIFDMLSIIPFYTEVSSIAEGGRIDFAVLASSPEPLILVAMKSLKIFRLFKITRHFKAAQVLIETAQKVWKQIIGMLVFLMFIITVFAILLFEVEQGEGCYVGDARCHVPSEAESIVSEGQFIFINKQGDLSQFPNALYGLWFSIVTMTSTGYGDLIPSTNAGLIMAVALMLFGAMYMAMPLTAAASVFYVIHENYNEHRQQRKKRRKSSNERKGTDPDAIGGAGKKGSLGRILGGGQRGSVTPEPGALSTTPKPKPQGGGVTTPSQIELTGRNTPNKKGGSNNNNGGESSSSKASAALTELSAKFDSRLQRTMELLMVQVNEISIKIELFLADLQCKDEAGPVVPVLEQATDIITSTTSCTALLKKDDMTTLEKLSVEFYKISLLPRQT